MPNIDIRLCHIKAEFYAWNGINYFLLFIDQLVESGPQQGKEIIAVLKNIALWKMALNVTLTSVHEKCDISPIDMKFTDDGAITIRHTLHVRKYVIFHTAVCCIKRR